MRQVQVYKTIELKGVHTQHSYAKSAVHVRVASYIGMLHQFITLPEAAGTAAIIEKEDGTLREEYLADIRFTRGLDIDTKSDATHTNEGDYFRYGADGNADKWDRGVWTKPAEVVITNEILRTKSDATHANGGDYFRYGADGNADKWVLTAWVKPAAVVITNEILHTHRHYTEIRKC